MLLALKKWQSTSFHFMSAFNCDTDDDNNDEDEDTDDDNDNNNDEDDVNDDNNDDDNNDDEDDVNDGDNNDQTRQDDGNQWFHFFSLSYFWSSSLPFSLEPTYTFQTPALASNQST